MYNHNTLSIIGCNSYEKDGLLHYLSSVSQNRQTHVLAADAMATTILID